MEGRSKKEIFGWAMFDFANSSFTTVIITVVFSAYFVSHVVGDDLLGVKYWGWGLALSNLVVMTCGPFVGAVADFSGLKKRFLFISYLFCVIFTALLFFVGKGDVIPALIIVIFANISFSAGENFCAAFLPEIARPDQMGKVSGYGWALGYIGGLLSLVICLLIFRFFGQGELQIRFTFLSTALFFLLSAIPTFLWLRERKLPEHLPCGETYIKKGYMRLRETFRDLADFGELMKFLFVFFLFSCGISTVIAFSAIYAESVAGFSKSETLIFFIAVQLSSSLGAFAFGFVEDRIGAKKTISITLVLWIAVVAAIWWSPSKTIFWLAGNLAGLAIGSSQSSSRAMVGLFTPRSKSAEFFGLWGMAAKLAATVGIFSYSLMTTISGSMRSGILLTALFFIAGLIGIMFINEERGKKGAADYESSL